MVGSKHPKKIFTLELKKKIELRDGGVEDVVEEVGERGCNGRGVDGEVHELEGVVVFAHREVVEVHCTHEQ